MSSPTTAGVPCPNCLTGYILPGEPSGKMVKAVSSLPEAYLASKHTKPSDGGRKKAIVLFTDIFGLPLVNCKIMADAFNERVGVDVYVPDLFQGKYHISHSLPFPSFAAHHSFAAYIRKTSDQNGATCPIHKRPSRREVDLD